MCFIFYIFTAVGPLCCTLCVTPLGKNSIQYRELALDSLCPNKLFSALRGTKGTAVIGHSWGLLHLLMLYSCLCLSLFSTWCCSKIARVLFHVCASSYTKHPKSLSKSIVWSRERMGITVFILLISSIFSETYSILAYCWNNKSLWTRTCRQIVSELGKRRIK